MNADIIRSLRKKMMSLFLLVFLTGTAQAFESFPFATSWIAELSCNVVQSKSFLWGGALYAPILSKYGLSAYGGFSMRCGSKAVLVRLTESSYNQYRERRLSCDFGLDESITANNHLGVYLRSGLGYTYAWYKGSDNYAKDGITPTFQAGIFFVMGNIESRLLGRVRIGYSYANLLTSGPHGVNFSIQIGYSAE